MSVHDLKSASGVVSRFGAVGGCVGRAGRTPSIQPVVMAKGGGKWGPDGTPWVRYIPILHPPLLGSNPGRHARHQPGHRVPTHSAQGTAHTRDWPQSGQCSQPRRAVSTVVNSDIASGADLGRTLATTQPSSAPAVVATAVVCVLGDLMRRMHVQVDKTWPSTG